MTYIKSHHRQNWLLPPNIEDLIPEDHICYLVEALIHSMDFKSFDIKYAGPGHPAYHPRILLKLLVIGVLNRVRSSRKLAQNARENIVYMYLAEKLAPDFRTISDFRKNNPELIKEVFKHTVTLARQAGALDLTHLATDGTKIKANAANKRTLTKDELTFLLKFVDEELKQWAKQDQIEDKKFGKLRGSDQLPNKSKKKIQKIVKYYIKKVKEKEDFKEKITQKLEKAQQEVKKHDLKKVSTTDPECRFMKNKKGRIEFSYNTQITTDKKGFIVANDTCQDTVDTKQLRPQVHQTKNNLGALPKNVPWSFDNNYFESENLAFLHEEKINGHVAVKKPNENPYSSDKFVYNPKKDEYTCPTQKPVTLIREQYDKTKKKTFRLYKGQGCETCTHRSLCTKRDIRYMKVYPHRELREAMAAKMQTTKAKETYKLRAQTAEPAIGDIKYNKGVEMFLTRSLETVKTEFNLACIASNIKKIWIRKKNKSTKHPRCKTIRVSS